MAKLLQIVCELVALLQLQRHVCGVKSCQNDLNAVKLLIIGFQKVNNIIQVKQTKSQSTFVVYCVQSTLNRFGCFHDLKGLLIELIRSSMACEYRFVLSFFRHRHLQLLPDCDHCWKDYCVPRGVDTLIHSARGICITDSHCAELSIVDAYAIQPIVLEQKDDKTSPIRSCKPNNIGFEHVFKRFCHAFPSLWPIRSGRFETGYALVSGLVRCKMILNFLRFYSSHMSSKFVKMCLGCSWCLAGIWVKYKVLTWASFVRSTSQIGFLVFGHVSAVRTLSRWRKLLWKQSCLDGAPCQSLFSF